MNIFYRVIIFIVSIIIQAVALAEQPIAAQAAHFSLKTELGAVISLGDYEGKPLVLHFWATWCPYCKKLQPGLDTLYLEYQKQGLEMVAISFWEDDGAKPQAELLKRGMHFTTLVDGDNVAKLYQVKGTPTTFFINKSGKVLWKTSNSDPDNPKLEQAIRAIITSS